MLTMLLMVCLIYRAPKEKLKFYLILYLFFLCVMAYFYIPSSSADLARYVDAMNYYASLNWSHLSELLLNSNAPIQILYFYGIGKLGNDHLLPAITAFLFYGNIFFILYKSSKTFHLNNKAVALSLLFFMVAGKFVEAISIIRSSIAFSLVALCCYNEIVEHRSILKDIPFYIIAVFIHPAAMVLVLIRILFLLFQKEKKLSKKILHLFFFGLIVLFLYRYGQDYLNVVYNKAETYLNGDVYSYIWEYIICFLSLSFGLYNLFFQKKYFIDSKEMQNWRIFTLIVHLIVLFFVFEYSIFTRFQAFASILFIPLCSKVLNDMSKDESYLHRNYYFFFFAIAVLIFIVAGTRGNLSGYKFLVFGE